MFKCDETKSKKKDFFFFKKAEDVLERERKK